MIAPETRLRQRRMRLAILAAILIMVAALYSTGAMDAFTIAGTKARLAWLQAQFAERPAAVIAGFILVQVAALAFCLPGAVLAMALAGGALFGALPAILIVLIAIALGDSLGFLIARYLLRDFLADRLQARIGALAHRQGAAYLFALRMMTVVPYFVVTISMALTRMPLRVFAPVSFIALVPAVVLYSYAGAALSEIDEVSDIMSPSTLAVFLALALLPVIARWAFANVGKRNS